MTKRILKPIINEGSKITPVTFSKLNHQTYFEFNYTHNGIIHTNLQLTAQPSSEILVKNLKKLEGGEMGESIYGFLEIKKNSSITMQQLISQPL